MNRYPFKVREVSNGGERPQITRLSAGVGRRAESISIERLQASLAAFTPSFVPKELDLLQFRGKAYFVGERPPAEYDFDSEAGSHAERYHAPREHRIVAAMNPEQGTFKRFDDETMWKIANEAMPGVAMQDSPSSDGIEHDLWDRERIRAGEQECLQHGNAGRILGGSPRLGRFAHLARGRCRSRTSSRRSCC